MRFYERLFVVVLVLFNIAYDSNTGAICISLLYLGDLILRELRKLNVGAKA